MLSSHMLLVATTVDNTGLEWLASWLVFLGLFSWAGQSPQKSVFQSRA